MKQASAFETVFPKLVDIYPEGLSQRAINLRKVIFEELSAKDLQENRPMEFTTGLKSDLASLNIAVSREDDLIIVRCSGISKGILLDQAHRDCHDILSSVEIAIKTDGTIVYEAYWLQGENSGILELSQVVNPDYTMGDMLNLDVEMDCRRVSFAVISGTDLKIPIFKYIENRVVQKYMH